MLAAGGTKGRVLGLKGGNPEKKRGNTNLERSFGICTKVPPGIRHAPEGQYICANLIKWPTASLAVILETICVFKSRKLKTVRKETLCDMNYLPFRPNGLVS